MKRHIIHFQIIALFLLLPLAKISHGQQSSPAIKPDPRLYDCMEKSYIDGLKSKPKLLLYYNFFLDNSYYVADAPDKKVNGIEISTVSLRNPDASGKLSLFSEDFSNIKAGSFNPLKYDFHTQPNLFTNYILGKSGKVLVFYSEKVFTEKFNNYLKSINFETAK